MDIGLEEVFLCSSATVLTVEGFFSLLRCSVVGEKSLCEKSEL